MAKKSIELELEQIVAKYDQQAKSIMSDMNTKGILYSSFTIRERVKGASTLCNEEFTTIAENYNSKKDQIKINACLDDIFKKERDSLEKFCEQMPSIKCCDADFSDLRILKRHINSLLVLQRRKRLKETATLIIAALTLLVSLISVVQWFIPNPYETIEKEINNVE